MNAAEYLNLLAIVALCGWLLTSAPSRVRAQGRGAVQAPIFEIDPFWPKPLPNHPVQSGAQGVPWPKSTE